MRFMWHVVQGRTNTSRGWQWNGYQHVLVALWDDSQNAQAGLTAMRTMQAVIPVRPATVHSGSTVMPTPRALTRFERMWLKFWCSSSDVTQRHHSPA